MNSDTWYAFAPVAGSSVYMNARTGTVQRSPPDGMRSLTNRYPGQRRRSAATSGPWAVPFIVQPPVLPQELRLPPPLSEDPETALTPNASMLEPLLETWGTGTGPLFTAPHGVNLERDNCAPHLPEDFTTFLGRSWAASVNGQSVTWDLGALSFCTAFEVPLPGARDPNYLSEAETDTNAWVSVLRSSAQRGLHVDVHGKRDIEGEADCDLGLGACRFVHGDHVADQVVATLHEALLEALSGYKVDTRPRLQGRWRSVPRQSLTQASTALGYVSVQLELGYRLRRQLGRDRTLSMRFAAALARCAPSCCAALAKR